MATANRPTPALSAPRERALRAVAELSAEGPVTLAEAAARLGGHPNTTRQHLDRLHAEGFLAAELLAQGRPGRRPKGFLLTPLGRRALTTSSGAECSRLAGAVASYHIQTGGGPDEARAIGELWGEGSARPLDGEPAPPMEALVEVLDILGFAPGVQQAAEGPTLVLQACPLVNATENAPFLCTLHEGMIHGVLRSLGGRQRVTLERADPGAGGCRIHLS